MKKTAVSVVVYTIKYHKQQPCFAALEKQTCKDFELIVVDASEGVSKARNEGIKKASCDIIAFTEADGVPAPDWVEKILKHMKNEMGITGRVVHPRNDIFKTISSEFYPGDESAYVNFDVLRGGNMAFRKKVFEKVGLFDENIIWGFNETEFGLRYVKKYKLKYCPDVIFTHWYAKSLRHYLKKQFLFGQNNLYIWHLQGLSGGEILRRTIPHHIPFTKLSFVKTLGRIFLDLGIFYSKIKQSHNL